MLKVKVENIKQLEIVLQTKFVDEVIIARDSFKENDLIKLINKIKATGKTASIILERISRYEEIKDLRSSTDKIFNIANLDVIVVQNLDSFAYVLRKLRFSANKSLIVELNHTMNCYNRETKSLYCEMFNNSLFDNKQNIDDKKNINDNSVKCNRLRFVAPVELNIYEISDVGYDTLLAYGYIDTMTSANCLRKNTVNKENKEFAKLCIDRFDCEKATTYQSFIRDRKNKKLYYKTYCKYCYNKIFNTDVLYLLDKGDCDKLDGMDIRIDFTIENENEVRDILNKKMPTNFTRGHYKNSIF